MPFTALATPEIVTKSPVCPPYPATLQVTVTYRFVPDEDAVVVNALEATVIATGGIPVRGVTS